MSELSWRALQGSKTPPTAKFDASTLTASDAEHLGCANNTAFAKDVLHSLNALLAASFHSISVFLFFLFPFWYANNGI